MTDVLMRLRSLDQQATPAPWGVWEPSNGGLTLTRKGIIQAWLQVEPPIDAALIAEGRNALPSLLAAAVAAQRFDEALTAMEPIPAVQGSLIQAACERRDEARQELQRALARVSGGAARP